jgi:phosphoglycolate phosphatase
MRRRRSLLAFPMPKLVLFDIDGTLLLTAGAGRRAIVATLGEEVGDTRAFESISFDGKTDPQIVAEMLEAAGQSESRESERVRRLCERYVGLLARELERPTTRTTLMPGVEALLDRLEALPDVVLGLLTGNLAQGAALKLRSGGIDPARFRVGAYGSDAAHRPALPEIAARRAEPYFGRVPRGAEVVIIGDTPADIHCGEGIAARALGVATGAYSVSDLAACGPHAVFENLSDVEMVLDAILGERPPHPG